MFKTLKYGSLKLFIPHTIRVATVKMTQQKLEDELYEMSKPLARYADDEDLERMLKDREREGDPMLKFMKKNPQITPHGNLKKGTHTYMYLENLSTILFTNNYISLAFVHVYSIRRVG